MIGLMKYYQTILFVAFLVVINQNVVKAQSTSPDIERPPILAPSANAASLGKYGDIPVSQYTGVANVGIPIKTLEYAGMSVGISLSYHGGGIRVEEEASWTGLGWSLNAGGVITRSIRGLDDFPEYGNNPGKGYFKEDAIPSLDHPFHPFNYAHYTQGEYTMVHSFDGWGNNYPIMVYQRALTFGGLDGQPDIFNFNFNGHSGKFLIDKKRNASESYHVVLYSKEDLKVQLANNDVTGQQGFTITDETGNVYLFQQLELSRSRSGPSRTGKLLYDPSMLPAPGSWDQVAVLNRDIRNDNFANFYHPYGQNSYNNYISSWYLTKMVSPTGAEINFTYNQLSQYIKSLPTRSQKVTSTEVTYYPYGWNFSFTINETKNVYLHQISYPGTTVTFNTSDRLDMQPVNNVYAKKLDNIEFSYAGNLKNKWYLYYGYFNSGSGMPDYISKRLKLDYVQQGEGGNYGPRHLFEYNNSNGLVLPDKDSYAQDFYGYYNGQLSNNSKPYFVEYMPYYMDGLSPFNWIGHQACDRKVHAEYVEAGLLKKITYPTGGSTSFTYESNDFANGDRMNYYAGNYHLITGNGNDVQNIPQVGAIEDDIVTQGAGCRIREITNYEYTGKAASRKVLTYTQYVGGGLSTGKIMFAMKHFSIETWSTAVSYKLFSYNQYANASSAAGCPLGYSKVQELQYDAQNHYNGYIEYTFENEVESNTSMFIYKSPCPAPTSLTERWIYTADQSTEYFFTCPFPGMVQRRDVYPFNIPNVTHAFNGNNIDYSVYNANGTLVYQKVNVYEEKDKEKIKCIENHPRSTGLDYISIMFSETAVFKALTQSTVYQDGATSITKYSYDPNFKHYKAISVETSNSKKETVTTHFKYFTDYNVTAASGSAALGIKSLADKHILSPVEIIKQKTANNNTSITGAACFEYATNGKMQHVYAAALKAPVAAASFFNSTVNGSGVFIKDASYESKTSVGSFNSLGAPNDVTTVNDKTAFQYGYNQNYPIAQVANAAGNEVFFDGYEESGTWDGVVYDNSKSHTGSQSGRIDKPTAGELSYHSTKWLNVALATPVKYKYSGWIYSNGPGVEIYFFMKRAGETGYFTYVDAVSTSTTGQWVFLEKEYTVPADVVSLNIRVDNNGGGSVWFDDIRLHPAAAQMTTYTYNPLIGMTSQSDVANRPSYYEYDALGRLIVIRDQDRNVLKKLCYNFSGNPQSCDNVLLYSNMGISGNFVKNNCDIGYDGSTVTYNVYPGTYTSTVSQAIVDQQAIDELNANGQNYANTHGACSQHVYYNVFKSNMFQRNTCTAGYQGSWVTYQVWPGKYSSLISQEHADQQAQNDINANGQNYANAHPNATCTPIPTTIDLKNLNNTSQTFNATITNTSTGTSYQFTLTPNGGGAALGTIPIATYNIAITPAGGSDLYEWHIGSFSQTGTNSLSITGLYFNCCGEIQIDLY
jgi:YD repeat-containing protein